MDLFKKANMNQVDGMDYNANRYVRRRKGDGQMLRQLGRTRLKRELKKEMEVSMDNELKESTLEAIRLAFFQDWVEQATKDEIIEKLIQNDERGKKEMRYDNQTAKIDVKLELYRDLAKQIDENEPYLSISRVVKLLEYLKS